MQCGKVTIRSVAAGCQKRLAEPELCRNTFTRYHDPSALDEGLVEGHIAGKHVLA